MERRSKPNTELLPARRALRVYLLPRSGFALALLANLIWGTSFLASKVTLTVWGPFTASALRFALALAGMLIVLPALGLSIQVPRTRAVWLKVFLIGLTGFGLLYPLQLGGMTFIPSSLSAAIMLTAPLFVLVFTAGFLSEALSTQKIFAIAIGIVGGTILVSPGNLAAGAWSAVAVPLLLKGFLLTLLASLCLAVSVVLTRTVTQDIDSRSLTFWSMFVGEALLIPFALTENHAAFARPDLGMGIAALVFLALFCSVFAFLIWNRALAVASPHEIASTMHIKTPVAVLLGIAVAGEPLTVSIAAGTILVSFAVWLSQWQSKPVTVAAQPKEAIT